MNVLAEGLAAYGWESLGDGPSELSDKAMEYVRRSVGLGLGEDAVRQALEAGDRRLASIYCGLEWAPKWSERPSEANSPPAIP